jgi:hypothetical protein
VAAHDDQRAAAFSQQLRQAHQNLREQLAGIRDELGRDQPAENGLQVHCLAFCSALTTHHEGEDGGMFTELLDARPDFAPVIKNLVDDHVAIAAILRQVRALAEQAKTSAAESLPKLQRELDGLAAIAESHFGYEERAVGGALDGLRDTGWSRPVFSPGAPRPGDPEAEPQARPVG